MSDFLAMYISPSLQLLLMVFLTILVLLFFLPFVGSHNEPNNLVDGYMSTDAHTASNDGQ